MEQAKASKKFKVAFAAMAVALVAVVGGLIGVWAATQQTVKTSFNVQYTVGSNIAAIVTVKESINGTEDSVEFDTTATTVEGLELANIALTPQATSVTFTYTFNNVGTVPFRATLTDTSKAANVTIAYAGEDTEEEDVVVESETAQVINGTTYVDVAAGAEVEVTVTVTVKAPNKATASYVSDATNGVSWVLDSATYQAA